MNHRSLSRRDFIRLGAAGAAALAAPGMLASCGNGRDEPGPQAEDVARRSVAIDYASYYAPYPAFRRLAEARARRSGTLVRFSDDASGAAAQVASLTLLAGDRGGFRVIVVAPFDPDAVDAIAADAVGRGIRIVSFVVPLEHGTCAIAVDPDQVAALLVEHARAHASPGARVLLVAPPPGPVVPDPFVAYSADVHAALARRLTSGSLRVAQSITALGEADARDAVAAAVSDDPDLSVVLTASDVTALGAAAALRGIDGAYVGGAGAPAISGPRSLDALDGRGPLRCLVAPRLSTLADAVIDLPRALLRGEDAADMVIPARLFTPGSPLTRAARTDYQD